MSGEIPVKGTKGCQALIARCDFVIAYGLGCAQKLEDAIGGEIRQVESRNGSSAGGGDVG
jgi:hypothetical protein